MGKPVTVKKYLEERPVGKLFIELYDDRHPFPVIEIKDRDESHALITYDANYPKSLMFKWANGVDYRTIPVYKESDLIIEPLTKHINIQEYCELRDKITCAAMLDYGGKTFYVVEAKKSDIDPDFYHTKCQRTINGILVHYTFLLYKHTNLVVEVGG